MNGPLLGRSFEDPKNFPNWEVEMKRRPELSYQSILLKNN